MTEYDFPRTSGETYVSDCPECGWSETADTPLGAYFAGRMHYVETGQGHVPETEEIDG